MLANRTLLRDQNHHDESGADQDEEKLETPSKGNQQRGGVQPSLPDRTAAPSRELGITGPQSGKPGTGRGGPTPAKKSRGVSSLLMGVALPDFVRGKPGPGPAAVAIEEIEPLISPQDSEPVPAPNGAALQESAIRRNGIRWEDAAAVRRYLTWLHSQDHAAPADMDSSVDEPSTAARPTEGRAE